MRIKALKIKIIKIDKQNYKKKVISFINAIIILKMNHITVLILHKIKTEQIHL